MQKRAADTSGSLCVACSTDLQERVIFLWGPLKFSIFGESGGTSRPMPPATFFATLLPNASVRSLRSRDLACFVCHFSPPSPHLRLSVAASTRVDALWLCTSPTFCRRFPLSILCTLRSFLSALIPLTPLPPPRLHLRKKCRFLRFPSHFPLLYLASLHRLTNGRRPREERHNSPPPKVLFVKIAPSPHLSCFCQWSGKYPPFPLVTPEYPDHPSLHYSLLDGVPSRVSQFPPTICLVLGVNSPNISHLWLCSRGYPREKSPSPPEKSL